MRILHFIYQGFSEYEVGLACSLMATAGEITTVGVDDMVLSEGGLQVSPHLAVKEVKLKDYDGLIVSGALEMEDYLDREEVINFFDEAYQAGLVLGAICSGPVFLALAGVLENKKFTCGLSPEDQADLEIFEKAQFEDSSVVVDGNLITAQGFATLEFALALGEKLKVFKKPEQRQHFEQFWRGM